MRLSSRILSIVLALLTVGSTFIGCAETEDETEEETLAQAETTVSAAETEPETDMNGRLSVKDNLPENIDFNGSAFTVYVAGGGNNDYMGGPEELTGDVVLDTVFNRNLTVENRLNIELVYHPDADANWSNVAAKINKYLMAGDTTFDLFLGQQYGIVTLIPRGGFCNVNELEYIDFTQPWWNAEFMDKLSIGQDTRFFLVGDYILSALQTTHVLYFNKDIYANMNENVNALYEEVLEGTWTLDRFSEVTEKYYIDLNHNGKTDLEDQLGYVTYLADASVDPFMYLAGIPYSSRDEEGNLTLNLNDERAVSLTEKVVSFFHQPGNLFDVAEPSDVQKQFLNGASLFLGCQLLSSSSGLRDMEDDFGFLPYPKLEETQENYHSVVADVVLLGAVPVTSLNLDKTGVILEALSSESFRTVVPAWYETALKIKYSRDDISAQIIDIVHDSMTTDFIYAYSPQLFNIGQIMRQLVKDNSTAYASAVAKRERTASKGLGKLVDEFNKNN